MSAAALATAPVSARAPRARLDPTRLARLTLADVLERTRRPGYLVSLLVMVWLAQHMLPENGAGYRTFVMNDLYRPVYNSAWVGTLTALLTGMWFLFVGFYLVKGSIERDRRTGVGQILAASRLGDFSYLWSRALGNLAVLASQAAVVAAVALFQQQLLGEDRRLDLIAALAPFLTITLPLALFTAAAAVFFDSVRWLRGGLGNFAWFFLLGLLLASGKLDDPGVRVWRDISGARLIANDARATLLAAHPDQAGKPAAFSMGVNMSPRFRSVRTENFTWNGIHWDAEAVASRLPVSALAMLIVFAAAIPFDRFDAAPRPAAGVRRTPAWLRPKRSAAPMAASRPAVGLTVAPRSFRALGVVRAEMALLLKGQSTWWYLGMLGFLVAEIATPLAGVRQVVLPLASFWPALLWSALGSRERRHDTGSILFSCPRPVERLLPAAWAAGATIVVLAGSPALLRLALAGEWASVMGWGTCAMFVPALALASGVWTGGPKFFEVLYLFLWYAGPMHHLALFDYTGVTAPRTPALAVAYPAVAFLLFALAWAGRSLQTRH